MAQEWRVIEMSGVHNFRDYGGYAVAGGGRLRREMLWRSGQHHGASDADLARIAALNLGAVYDLRFDDERRSHPCRRPPGFAGQVFFASETPQQAAPEESDDLTVAPHVAAARTGRGRDAASMRRIMAQVYTVLPFRPNLVTAMRHYVAGVANGNGPSLVHCMAGKDRTGIAVAMLHRAVGVHHDDVMADYLLTNTAGDVEARIASGGAVVQARSGPMEPDALRVIMGVEPEYLDTAFSAMTERYGSEDAYLAEALGADEKVRAKLREKLVEG